MPYFNSRFKGVKSDDSETYSGYPSEFMHNPRQQKSRIYGGELLDLEDRKQLKYLHEELNRYHQTAIARDINNVKKRRS